MSRYNRSARRRAYNIPGHAHELTFSTYRRYPFLRAERCCQWLADAIAASRDKQAFWVWAYVFMPDHVHLLLYPHTPVYDIGRILESIKRPIGIRAIAYLEERQSFWLARLTRRRGTRTERLFWQSGGGYDRNITSPRTLLAAIDYIHLNPVRKELVGQAADWQWSSARHYQGGISPAPIDPIPPAWLEVELE
jgi:putative transposase